MRHFRPFPLALAALAMSLLLASCADDPAPTEVRRISGPTMGSTYTVLVPATGGADMTEVRERVEAELQAIDREMSTWRKDSELSQFNASPSLEWTSVSIGLAMVCVEGQAIAAATEGAYDLTVQPLMRLWRPLLKGAPGATEPSADAETAARAIVGFGQFEARLEPPALRKAVAGLEVDVSSIAPGHAADRLSSLLTATGHPAHFVDVGGEIVVRGEKAPGVPWTVGIERPAADRSAAPVAMTVISSHAQPTGFAVATSGNYRSYAEVGKVRRGHILDLQSGRPVENDLASVTVISDRGSTADAWATALFVLGSERALAVAERLNLAVLLVRVEPDGRFENLKSKAFSAFEP